ncbi:MAG: hypothetical protein ACKOAF_08550 [Actinomycetes bacterium]
MRMSLRAALVGLVALVAALGTVAPAQAGVDTPRVLLGNVNGHCALASGADSITVTGNPGDSFRVFNLGCGPIRVLFSGGAATGPSSIPQYGSGTYTLTSAPNSGSFLIRPDESVTHWPFLIDVNVVSSPVATPAAPEVHGGLQQVGVPASGSCDDVPFWAGHYDGYPVGGWGKSWAMWIYGGNGGPVCTREIYFDLNNYEYKYVGQR